MQEANKLKGNGVQLFIVAVGRRLNLPNLQKIASGEKKVFYYQNFDTLKTVTQDIAVRSCKGVYNHFIMVSS